VIIPIEYQIELLNLKKNEILDNLNKMGLELLDSQNVKTSYFDKISELKDLVKQHKNSSLVSIDYIKVQMTEVRKTQDMIIILDKIINEVKEKMGLLQNELFTVNSSLTGYQALQEKSGQVIEFEQFKRDEK
jgi:hypothetical protein